ncbi:MAG: dipeptide ABC transporter ATP-binding protein [Actinobacteria bacterium]|nr:dipeptide ABC transporter ATP-binding protein [Actinomycetota bacterium]
MTPILEVRDVKKYFPSGSSRVLQRPTGQVKAVDGVSLALQKGKTLGVVGESGCGKSTLARVLTRLIEPSSGSIFLEGEDVTRISGSELRRMRRDIQIIFQDPYSSLNPRHSVGEIISTPLRIQKTVAKSEEVGRVKELMHLVGLNPEHFNRYPHEFSGGQRQRVGIARSLALNPKVIVADEPVSALDVSIQSQILNLMQDLQTKLQVAFVFIAHDLSVVRHIADDVAVMYLGKIVELGPANIVYTHPTHPYTKALMSAVPVANPVSGRKIGRIVLTGDVPSPIDPPSGCRFRTRCWKAQDICASNEPELLDRGDGRVSACHFPELEA